MNKSHLQAEKKKKGEPCFQSGLKDCFAWYWHCYHWAVWLLVKSSQCSDQINTMKDMFCSGSALVHVGGMQVSDVGKNFHIKFNVNVTDPTIR